MFINSSQTISLGLVSLALSTEVMQCYFSSHVLLSQLLSFQRVLYFGVHCRIAD